MIRHLLNDVLTVERATYADDGRGGRSKTMTTVGTVRGRVMPLPRVVERIVASEWAELELRHVHVLYGSDVRREDVLTSAKTGEQMRVQVVESDSGHTYTLLQCEVLQEA